MLIQGLFHWLLDLFIDWLSRCYWSIDRLVDCLVGSFVGWLVDWLSACLIDVLICRVMIDGVVIYCVSDC